MLGSPIQPLNNWDQTVIRETIFLASEKVFVEDPGKDLYKVVLGSFPRSFRIFNLRIQGSFVYLSKIFIDLSRFSDRSWRNCLPRSLKFLYWSCYDLQKSLRILYKTTWWFQKVPLKGSFVCIAKIFVDLWSFFYRFCSKGLPRSLKFLYRSCNHLQKSFTDLAKILHGSLKLLACFSRIFEHSAYRTCARFQFIQSCGSAVSATCDKSV